jgi:hypothetical protein
MWPSNLTAFQKLKPLQLHFFSKSTLDRSGCSMSWALPVLLKVLALIPAWLLLICDVLEKISCNSTRM